MKEENKESEERSNNDKVVAKLAEVQQSLKVEKSNRNAFAGFNYRTCSDILSAVKPFLGGAVLTMTDEVLMTGDRYYIKATATLTYEGQSISVNGLAREAQDKKGMDDAQVTGTASTYSRKYALNGLFAIDDSKADPDHGVHNPDPISTAQISRITENYRLLDTAQDKISAGVRHVSGKRTGMIAELYATEAQSLIGQQDKRIKSN